MALDFTVKDVIHKVMAKFTPAFLPDAKKPFNLKAVIVPALTVGKEYALKVVTQSSAKHGSGLLKDLRELRSEFKLTAQSA
jgi:hypothetical protein